MKTIIGIIICDKCKAGINLTPFNLLNISEDIDIKYYVCEECDYILGIIFENQIIPLETILKVDWNENIKERKRKLDENLNLYFAVCEEKKDFIIIRLLQNIAKKERNLRSFRYFKEKEGHMGGLLFDIVKNKYIGYIMWTDSKEVIVLRQIFVREEERCNGYGQKLLKYWREKFVDKDQFGIESPNLKLEKTLKKLGYYEGKDYFIVN